MKLNKKSREEIRKYLLKELETLQEGVEKIKIPKEILETLLFEVNPQTKAKQLVFSGPFLKKIDLSEVSFDNVDWSCETEKFLSYTNVKIDFSKAANTSAVKNLLIEGVDLSNSNFDVFNYIIRCNLKNTKAKINMKKVERTSYSILTGIDLSSYKISLYEYISKMFATDLSNTGICINLSDNDLKNIHSKNNVKIPYASITYKQYLNIKIKDGSLDNCYINGVRIKSKEEQEKIKNTKREEYEEMKENLKKSLVKQIEQVKSNN